MKIINFLLLFMFSSFFLASCNNNIKEDQSIPTTSILLGEGALIAFGFNQLTGKAVAINTLTGHSVDSCPENKKYPTQLSDIEKRDSKKLDRKQLCDFRIVNDDGRDILVDHLGKQVKGAIPFTIRGFSFTGSHCVYSEVVGGVEYTGCYSTQEVCSALAKDSVAQDRWREFYAAKC